MKLLHVITGLNVGGAETMLARLLEQGPPPPAVRSEVVTLVSPGKIGERVIATGTPVHDLGMREGVPSPSAIMRLRRIVRSARPDLIVGWMHHGQLAASLAALLAPGRPPVIWNVRHSLTGFSNEKPLTRALLRIGAALSRTPAAITYNSAAAAGQYRRFGFRPRRQQVIDNGFDASIFPTREEARARIRAAFDIPPTPLLVGLVARNHEMKDVAGALDAFARLRRSGIDAHLLLVGEGMDAIRSRFPADLPAGFVTISGHRTDVADWLGGLDIAMLSSAWGEAFPNIVGEAMAAGVPCAVTDVGDAARIVAGTGRIVPPRNAEAMARALRHLADIGPEGRLALGNMARDRIRNEFSIGPCVRRFHTLFGEVVAGRAPGIPSRSLAPAGDLS